MRIVGFMGSPRQKHNTAVLVGEVLQGAKEQGADIQVYDLNELNISGCQACMTCKSEDACALDDDMGRLYEEVLQADGVVIGSPVYMWQMSAQTKLFVDRLFAMLRPDFSTRFKRGLPLVLVYTQGQPDREAFQSYFDHTRKMFEFLGFEVKETLVAAGTRAKDDVVQQGEVMDQAKQVGRSLVA
jgi:multimeric flavodoxin WrbA